MVKQLDQQFDMAIAQKNMQRETVSLTKMNKYVGYESAQLIVSTGDYRV